MLFAQKRGKHVKQLPTGPMSFAVLAVVVWLVVAQKKT